MLYAPVNNAWLFACLGRLGCWTAWACLALQGAQGASSCEQKDAQGGQGLEVDSVEGLDRLCKLPLHTLFPGQRVVRKKSGNRGGGKDSFYPVDVQDVQEGSSGPYAVANFRDNWGGDAQRIEQGILLFTASDVGSEAPGYWVCPSSKAGSSRKLDNFLSPVLHSLPMQEWEPQNPFVQMLFAIDEKILAYQAVTENQRQKEVMDLQARVQELLGRAQGSQDAQGPQVIQGLQELESELAKTRQDRDQNLADLKKLQKEKKGWVTSKEGVLVFVCLLLGACAGACFPNDPLKEQGLKEGDQEELDEEEVDA